VTGRFGRAKLYLGLGAPADGRSPTSIEPTGVERSALASVLGVAAMVPVALVGSALVDADSPWRWLVFAAALIGSNRVTGLLRREHPEKLAGLERWWTTTFGLGDPDHPTPGLASGRPWDGQAILMGLAAFAAAMVLGDLLAGDGGVVARVIIVLVAIAAGLAAHRISHRAGAS
jgi:hypothetical protein